MATPAASEDGKQQATTGEICPAAVASPLRALESAALTNPDIRGRVWEVHAIESGVSKNGLDWLAETLERDARALEGIPIRVTWNPLDHHNTVGALRGVESVRLPDGRVAIRGRVEIDDSADGNAAATRLLAEYRRGDPLHLSIDTPIRSERTSATTASGKRVDRVLGIRRDETTELTIVRRGAAGGKFMRATAGEGDVATESTGHAAHTTTTNQEGSPMTTPATAETTKQDDAGAAERRAKEAADAAEKATIAEQRAREAEAKVAESIRRNEEVEKRMVALAAASEKRAKESEFKCSLTERLAASKLPAIAVERVRESFMPAGGEIRVAEVKDIDAAIEAERKYLARAAESFGAGRISGLGEPSVSVGLEPRDRIEAAMDGYFAGEDMPPRAKQKEFKPSSKAGASLNGFRRARESFLHDVASQGSADAVPRFYSLRQAAEVVANGGRRMSPREVLGAIHGWHPAEQRATESYRRAKESLATTDLAEVFGDSIRRKMLADTAMDEKMALVRRLASEITRLEDFRTNRRIQLGGYGLLTTVGQGGTYPTLTSPGDQEYTFAAAKKGGLEDITEEMIANDDQGVIAKIPQRLQKAAVETLYQDVLDIIKNNSNAGDAAALFRSGNKTTGAFTKANMNTARQTMRQQSPYGDATKKLGAVNLPRLWLGPADLEETAERIFGSGVMVQDANFNATETPNIHGKGQTEVHVVDYWTDSADCALVADPSKAGINTLELGFYQGQQVPELVVADAASVGARFTADKITWKIRFVYGFAFLDYRHFYGFSRA